jgi:hypothetical protein
MSEETYEMKRDATPQASLRVAEREHVTGEDEPHSRVAKPTQRPLRRLRGCLANQAERGGHDDATHADDGWWNRLGDESSDHGGKESEVPPRVDRQTIWHGCEEEGHTNGNRDEGLEERPTRVPFVRRGSGLRRWARTLGNRHAAPA